MTGPKTLTSAIISSLFASISFTSIVDCRRSAHS
jgi:hypothetical protein